METPNTQEAQNPSPLEAVPTQDNSPPQPPDGSPSDPFDPTPTTEPSSPLPDDNNKTSNNNNFATEIFTGIVLGTILQNPNSNQRQTQNTFQRTPTNIATSPQGSTQLSLKVAQTPAPREKKPSEKLEDISERLRVFLPNDHDQTRFWIFQSLVELTLFMFLTGILVSSLTIDRFKYSRVWDLETWRWCLLGYSILVGGIIVKWVTDFVVSILDFWAHRNSSRDDDDIKKSWENFAHVVRGLRGSVQVFVWVALVLISWVLLFRHGVEKPEHVSKDLNRITRGLAASVVGVFIWLLKTLSLELLGLSFIAHRSRKEIKQSCEDQEHLRAILNRVKPERRNLDTIDEENISRDLIKMNGRKVLMLEYELIRKVRHWTPKHLILKISSIELPVTVMGGESEVVPMERVARATADWLFAEIAMKCGAIQLTDEEVQVKSFKMEDVQDHVLLEELKKVTPPVKSIHGGLRLKRSDFRRWMIKVYKQRLVLLRTINGRDNVLGDLNRIASFITLVVILIVWLWIMKLLTADVSILIASQILAWKFIFGDTVQTAFEAVAFIFVTRPFDVGDPCMIGKDELTVHDMNILSTIFKMADGATVYYPNSALMSNDVVNFYNVPDTSYSIEFRIDANTSSSDIEKLIAKIEEYLDGKNKIWKAKDRSIKVKKVKNEVKTLILNVNHAVNFYNGGDKKKHRGELEEKLEKIIEDLHIRLC